MTEDDKPTAPHTSGDSSPAKLTAQCAEQIDLEEAAKIIIDANRTTVKSAYVAGAQLLRLVKHPDILKERGEIFGWARRKCGIKRRTVYNWMNTANLVNNYAKGDCATLQHLDASTVYKLASASDKLKKQVIAASTEGSPLPTKDVARAIADEKKKTRPTAAADDNARKVFSDLKLTDAQLHQIREQVPKEGRKLFLKLLFGDD